MSLQLRNDTLVEIATFLVRRWSDNDKIVVEFSQKKVNETRLKENRVVLIPIEEYQGDEFGKYRQFRTAVWYESMRIKNCKKILSNDHAFGFVLNTFKGKVETDSESNLIAAHTAEKVIALSGVI